MNTVGTMNGGRRPDWLSKVEHAVNRAADVLLEKGESLAKELDDAWKSFARHFSRKHS